MTEIRLPVWQFRGGVDDMPAWLASPGHAVSEATPTEQLSAGRRAVPGEKVLRLADGRTMALGDYAVRGIAGDAPVIMHAADLEQRHGGD